MTLWTASGKVLKICIVKSAYITKPPPMLRQKKKKDRYLIYSVKINIRVNKASSKKANKPINKPWLKLVEINITEIK